MSERRPPEVVRIVEAFNRHGVEYLLVGGVAATAHGARRQTLDADTVIRRSAANLEAAAAALRDLHARVRVDGLSDEEAKALPMQIDAVALSRMEISTWRTNAGDLDVLVEMPAADGTRLSYEDLLPRAVDVTYSPDDVLVRIAGLDDIIASKQWANRPKDREALPELRAILDARDSRHGAPEREAGPG